MLHTSLLLIEVHSHHPQSSLPQSEDSLHWMVEWKSWVHRWCNLKTIHLLSQYRVDFERSLWARVKNSSYKALHDTSWLCAHFLAKPKSASFKLKSPSMRMFEERGLYERHAFQSEGSVGQQQAEWEYSKRFLLWLVVSNKLNQWVNYLFRLWHNEVCQRDTIKQLHDDVYVLTLSKWSVIFGDIWMI